MARQFFGTDGIRGRVGDHPMTAEFAMRLASAAARVLAPEGGRVVIGKDTRVSGYMFESALEAGFEVSDLLPIFGDRLIDGDAHRASPDDNHFDAATHEMVAETLYRRIADRPQD